MERPRGVGGGTMSAPRTEDPERERSGSTLDCGIGAADGLARARDGAPLVPPTVVPVLAMVPLVLLTVVLAPPTVVLAMLALLTVVLSPADTRARRSEQELKTRQ